MADLASLRQVWYNNDKAPLLPVVVLFARKITEKL